MKKIFTLALLLLPMVALSTWSQTNNTFCFVDKDGKEVADGAKLTMTESEDDGWGGILIPSGLSVKNTADEEVSLRIHCQLQTIDNGAFQICFPTNCITKEHVETFVTPSGPMNGGEVKNLLTEWTPESYGKCTAVYQVEVMKMISLIPLQYESLGMGPSVTVEYVYANPADIENVRHEEMSEPSAYYHLNGIRQDTPQRGLNIVRMKNGKVVKQFMR